MPTILFQIQIVVQKNKNQSTRETCNCLIELGKLSTVGAIDSHIKNIESKQPKDNFRVLWIFLFQRLII